MDLRGTMDNLTKFLRVLLVFSLLTFLITFLVVPKTDCQVCKLEYEGKVIDGYDAFDIYEEECISYDKPWDTPEFKEINYYTGIDGDDSQYTREGVKGELVETPEEEKILLNETFIKK